MTARECSEEWKFIKEKTETCQIPASTSLSVLMSGLANATGAYSVVNRGERIIDGVSYRLFETHSYVDIRAESGGLFMVAGGFLLGILGYLNASDWFFHGSVGKEQNKKRRNER